MGDGPALPEVPGPAAAACELRPLSGKEFDKFAALARQKFGLDLRKGKEELVAARLGKQVRGSSFRSFGEYYDHLLADPTGEALMSMINALTTNHTSFFREQAHFEFLTGTVLAEVSSKPAFRLWSAACSSGEEPYSILMTLAQAMQPSQFERVEILATDISTRVLRIAERAIYPEERLQGVPRAVQARCLLRGEGKSAGYYRVKPDLVRHVQFRRMNLIEPLPPMPAFDVIFCRNVMIYFDRPTQEGLVNRLAERLEPGGYLLVGHAESLTGVQHALEYVKPSIYRKARQR